MRRGRVLVSVAGLVLVGFVVAAAMGRDVPHEAAVVEAKGPTEAGCDEAPAEVVRSSGRSEDLAAGWVPEGFVRTSGGGLPAFPRLAVTYSAPGSSENLELSRVITTAPAEEHIDPGPRGSETLGTVRGRPASVVQGPDLDGGGGSRVLIAWKELPDVTVIASGYRSSLAEVQRFAESAVYQRGELPAGTETSACQRTLPAGALTRQDILEASAGPEPEAKLVRLADLETLAPGLLQCETMGCDPGVVAWAVLTHDFASRYGGPMGSVPTGPGWTLVVLEASTGHGRGGGGSGPGEHPAFWPQLEDLAP